MADFSSLDRETRAFALVGQFLHRWAATESVLHDCIQTAFKLTPTMRHIICANISLHDKLNILRTMVDVLDIDKAKYDKLLRRVEKRAKSRNIVAHVQFQPNDKGTGVRFIIVKAKGTYGTPSIIWTEKRFEQECCLLDGIKAQLTEFNDVLGKSPITDQEGIVKSIWIPFTNWPMPMRRRFAPAIYNFQSPPISSSS